MVAGDRISTIIIFYLPLYALFCFSMEKGIGMNKSFLRRKQKFCAVETFVFSVQNKSLDSRKTNKLYLTAIMDIEINVIPHKCKMVACCI